MLWQKQESKPKLSSIDLHAQLTKDFKNYIQLTANITIKDTHHREINQTMLLNSSSDIEINEFKDTYHPEIVQALIFKTVLPILK